MAKNRDSRQIRRCFLEIIINIRALLLSTSNCSNFLYVRFNIKCEIIIVPPVNGKNNAQIKIIAFTRSPITGVPEMVSNVLS